MVNSNAIVVMMVIYAICHSTALSQDFSTRAYSEALKTFSGFQSKGLNTQDTQRVWRCTGSRAQLTTCIFLGHHRNTNTTRYWLFFLIRFPQKYMDTLQCPWSAENHRSVVRVKRCVFTLGILVWQIILSQGLLTLQLNALTSRASSHLVMCAVNGHVWDIT